MSKHYHERTDPCPHPGCGIPIRITATSYGLYRFYHGEDLLGDAQVSILPGPGEPREEDYQTVLREAGKIVAQWIAEKHWKMARAI